MPRCKHATNDHNSHNSFAFIVNSLPASIEDELARSARRSNHTEDLEASPRPTRNGGYHLTSESEAEDNVSLFYQKSKQKSCSLYSSLNKSIVANALNHRPLNQWYTKLQPCPRTAPSSPSSLSSLFSFFSSGVCWFSLLYRRLL